MGPENFTSIDQTPWNHLVVDSWQVFDHSTSNSSTAVVTQRPTNI